MIKQHVAIRVIELSQPNARGRKNVYLNMHWVMGQNKNT